MGAGSERQVIAVVCGSGIGDVPIELWIPFVWLDTLCEWRCERGVSVCGEEGGGPCDEGVMCLKKLNAGYAAMCCAFPGSSIGFCIWGGVISSKNQGVGTLA